MTAEATYKPIATVADLESIERDTDGIGIYDCRISDDMMAALSRFPSLKRLILRYSTFSAQGTAHLRALIRLEELDCKESTLCDEGLEAIAGLPSLKTLDLRLNPVTDRGLEVLPSFPQLDLVRLDLNVGLFSGRALRALVLEKLPHVEFVAYGGTGGPLSASTDFSRIVLNKKMVRRLKSFSPEKWRR